ncbi:unnamed protein product [Brassica rapa]|uniref:Uncharacterized protein n=2 Tax=Brassica TaxID=3705 RepID=A0A8D9H3M0_BRACM|nr:unnamed protein product [Brassica napus]CAG7892334.1 unnamed protein product [Brassica rapa]
MYPYVGINGLRDFVCQALMLYMLVVTTSGEALMVRIYNIHKTSCTFYVFKKNHATNKWDEMASLATRL